MTKHIDIVFEEGIGPMNMRFIEVEDGSGRSISAGEWFKREDGYYVLRIDQALMRRFFTPAGWRLVPVEANQDMTAAAGVEPCDDRTAMMALWRKMCFAAPPPPSPAPLSDNELASTPRGIL